MSFLMGRFDVSEIELSEAPHKCWSNRDGLSKHAKFPRKNRGSTSHGVQQTSGCPGNRRRYSKVVDVTHFGTLLCVGGAIDIKGAAFSARLTSTRFFGPLFEILRGPAWTVRRDLTWRKDVLEAGERCVDNQPSPGRRGFGQSRRDDATRGDCRPERRRLASSRHRCHCRRDPQPLCSGRAGGNSGIIKGRCAERRVHR
jgi:hypothetical protein